MHCARWLVFFSGLLCYTCLKPLRRFVALPPSSSWFPAVLHVRHLQHRINHCNHFSSPILCSFIVIAKSTGKNHMPMLPAPVVRRVRAQQLQ